VKVSYRVLTAADGAQRCAVYRAHPGQIAAARLLGSVRLYEIVDHRVYPLDERTVSLHGDGSAPLPGVPGDDELHAL
jgi:hypothetical protein